MIPASIALLAGVLHGACAPTEEPAKPVPSPQVREVPTAPPRAPIAGLAGLELRTRVVFEGVETPPHRLTATYVFPDRVRWQLATGEVEGARREIRLRYGEAVHLVPAAGSTRLLDGTERDAALREFELLRALVLWPDGFAWKEEGEARRASLGTLGSLRADPSPDATRPRAIACLDAAGSEVLALRAVRWSEGPGRRWPAAFEVWSGGSRVLTHTVEGVDVETRFLDAYFLPAELRDPAVDRPVPRAEVREIPVPEHRALRVELAARATWADVRREDARARAAWGERLAALGLRLDPRTTVELGDELAPRVLLLRLATDGEGAPEEFVARAAGRAVATLLAQPEAVEEAALARLRAALPAGTRAGRPYLRYDPSSGPASLVLPFDRGAGR